MKLQYYPEGETEDLDENKIMTRKPYIKPAIVNEFELETRAGSPLNVDPMDPNTWEAPNPICREKNCPANWNAVKTI